MASPGQSTADVPDAMQFDILSLVKYMQANGVEVKGELSVKKFNLGADPLLNFLSIPSLTVLLFVQDKAIRRTC
jgi:hypothetical protein